MFAGRNVLFRGVAVVLTLSIVATVFLGLSSLLYASVESFAQGNRLELYREQFVNLVSAANVALLELPDRLSFLPNATQDQLRTTVMDLERAVHLNNTFFIENQEFIVDSLKEAVGSSSTLLTEVGLYVLYTTMWLFVPLQINPDETKEKYAGKVFGVCNIWRSRAQLLPNAGHESSVEESTRGRMPFALYFYHTQSDPRQDLQERMYHIMQVYFSLKLAVNSLFAVCVWFLLFNLGVDLSGFLGVACLILSFIPELGTVVSIALPIPIILLMPMPADSPHSRAAILGRFVVGMILIKLCVSNVLESYVMGHNATLSGAVKNHELVKIKETHPVVILFFVVLSGQIWGPLGMLISVPLLSLFRLMLNVWHMRGPGDVEQSGRTTGASAGSGL